jgi:two-component system chemotaxis sensor kinase CheA
MTPPMDDLLRDFLAETNESLDVIDAELVRFERQPNDTGILDKIFRLVHTIKGTCGFVGLPRLEALAHAAETLMGRLREGAPVTSEAVTLILRTIDRIKDILVVLEREGQEATGDDADLIGALERAAQGGGAPDRVLGRGPDAQLEAFAGALRRGEISGEDLENVVRGGTAGPERSATPDAETSRGRLAGQSIRVSVETLEKLMTMVSELVLTRNQLLDIERRREDAEFKGPLQRLSSVTAALQDSIMKTRMQPISSAWQKLSRLVRDLAVELGKEIELEMRGGATELDRQLLDLIRDPLTHMIRNAADHGLETPEERRRAGKREKGTIRLSARHEGGHIIIELSDDGRGLDTQRIKAAAVARGLVSPADAEKMSEAQIHRLIFMPGFSTAGRVSSVSGRGVGMDVVRNNIEQAGGTIEVRSIPGEGASFTIKIPLTLAIVPALLVQVGEERFAIPQLSVVELVRIEADSAHLIEHIKDTAILRLRDRLLPLVSLATLLEISNACSPDQGFVVVAQVGDQAFGVVVDSVLHTEEIVVKPMAAALRGIGMFSGITILGDGSVVMIIDPNRIAKEVALRPELQETRSFDADRAQVQGVGGKAAHHGSFLVFRAGSVQPKAIPASLVTRLEMVDCKTIELADGRHLMQYRGELMPLIRASSDVRIRDEGTQPILVISESGRSIGLVVDEIVDIVEGRLEIDVTGSTPGVLGCAVIGGQATEIIDVAHFLALACANWFRGIDRPRGRAGPNVLLVDDSAFFRDMLTPVLRSAGFEVTSISAAAEAMTLLRQGQRFDAVITDIDMPGLDGLSFIAAVRNELGRTGLPVIALTSVKSPTMLAEGRRLDVHAFVAKFDRHGLLAALREAVGCCDEAA